jgi:hypothetical protein
MAQWLNWQRVRKVKELKVRIGASGLAGAGPVRSSGLIFKKILITCYAY